MDEGFELPVTYKGKDLLLPAQLQQSGYTHRFVVDVFGEELFFELDEERHYRALIDPEGLQNKKTDIDLLKAIAGAIEEVLK